MLSFLYVIYFLLYFHLITFPISFSCCYSVNYHFYIMLLLSSSCCHLVVTISVNKLILVSGVILSFYRFCYSIDSIWFIYSLVVTGLLLHIAPLIWHHLPLLSHDVRPLPSLIPLLQCASSFHSYMCVLFSSFYISVFISVLWSVPWCNV